jgi:2-phosphosulfolactate phosphatase
MILEVAYLPETLRNPGQKTCIVIDVVRASSTMVVMLDQGARSIILADSIAGARQAAASRPGTILCGESGGVAPQGFDMATHLASTPHWT